MLDTDLLMNGAEGTEKAVSGEDLFEAYQQGKSIEELQEMMNSAPDETTPAVMSEEIEAETDRAETVTNETGEEPDVKPFRVYQTREEFQKHFDHEWNKRYASMKSEMFEQKKRLEETSGLLADVLGVSKEHAFEELRSRKYAMEAEREGYADPDQYAALKNAESQIEEMKRAEESRRVDEQVADIRRQGDALAAKIPSFDIDKAMENEAFRQTVFTLHRTGTPDSVERAFRACFFDEFMKLQSATEKKEPVVRPKEGATAPRTSTAVKPVNVAGMSGLEIRKLERDILSGRHIDLG